MGWVFLFVLFEIFVHLFIWGFGEVFGFIWVFVFVVVVVVFLLMLLLFVFFLMGFVLSFENCIPLQVKIKQDSFFCVWVMVKDKKCPFMLSRIQKLEWELGRAYHFKTPGAYRGWKLWWCCYSIVWSKLLFAMQPHDIGMWPLNSLPPQ